MFHVVQFMYVSQHILLLHVSDSICTPNSTTLYTLQILCRDFESANVLAVTSKTIT